MGTWSVSSCSLTLRALLGEEIALESSLKPESVEYEFVRDCESAKSLADSMDSSHSAAEYLLPSGSEVVALGSSKMKCLSFCGSCQLCIFARGWKVHTVSRLQTVRPFWSR